MLNVPAETLSIPVILCLPLLIVVPVLLLSVRLLIVPVPLIVCVAPVSVVIPVPEIVPLLVSELNAGAVNVDLTVKVELLLTVAPDATFNAGTVTAEAIFNVVPAFTETTVLVKVEVNEPELVKL